MVCCEHISQAGRVAGWLVVNIISQTGPVVGWLVGQAVGCLFVNIGAEPRWSELIGAETS